MRTFTPSRKLAAVSAASAIFATPLLLTLPATAATPTLGIALSINADGTPDGAPPAWDGTSGGGLDSGPNDGVVRTFDTVEYRIDWNVNEADVTNLAVSATLPAGMFWAALPNPCQANLTPVSSISGVNLVCNLGARHEGESGTFTALAQLGSIADGTTLPLHVTSAADGIPGVDSPTVNVIASAGPKADLVSDLSSGTVLRGIDHPDTGVPGVAYYLPITLEVPGNGKGAEPLIAQDLHITLDGSSLPPSATLMDGTWSVSGIYAPWNECGTNNAPIVGVPFGTIGVMPVATSSAATANSGSWNCSFDSGTRLTTITVTGADLAPATRPTIDSTGFPMGVGRNILIAGVVAIWISDSDLQQINFDDYGTPFGTNSLPPITTSWDVLPIGVSGGPIVGEQPWNNSTSAQFEYTPPGGHNANYIGKFDVAYINEGAGDLTFPTPRALIASVPEHSPFVPTQTQVRAAGDGTVAVGERFGLSLEMGSNPDQVAGRKANCVQLSPGQTITPIGDYLEIDARPVGNLTAIMNNIPPVVTPRGPGSSFYGDLIAVSSMQMTAHVPWFAWFADAPLAPGDLTIEYSTDPHSYDGQCNSQYTWSATPPADLSTITQVRTFTNFDMESGRTLWIDLSLKALPQAVGSKIWHTSSGLDWAPGTAFDPDASWYINPAGPGYDPAAYCDYANGHPPTQSWNDCLTISGTRLAITKAVSSGKNAGLAAGEKATFTLNASSVGNPAGQVQNLVVSDSLPTGMHWTGVASPMPTNGAVAGDQDLEWNLGTVPNNEIQTITLEVEIEPGYTPFETITNQATVNADADNGSGLEPLPEASSGAQIQTSGTFASLEIQKATTTPLIDKNGTMSFSMTYTNSGVEDDVQPTFIDVLPWNGDGRSTPTAFTGTTALTSVSTTGGEEVRYTNAAQTSIHPDPDDPSNAIGSGSTKWCLASEFGTAGCPDAIGASTAIWVRYTADPAVPSGPGLLHPGEKMTVGIAISTSGNIADDAYANNFTGRAANLKLPVKSNTVTVRVRGVNLKVVKTAPSSAVIGGTGEFTISTTNRGPNDATNVELTDPLPAGMTYVSSSDGGTIRDGTVRWNIPLLKNGETKQVTVTVRFDAVGANQNTVSITGVVEDERSTDDNASTARLEVNGIAAEPTTSTTTTAAPSTTTTTAPAAPRGALPTTGNDPHRALWTGAVTFGCGALLMGLARRRRRAQV